MVGQGVIPVVPWLMAAGSGFWGTGGPPHVFLILVGGGFLLWLASYLPRLRRRRAFEELAEELGLRYQRRDKVLPAHYEFLHELRDCRGQAATNVLIGRHEGHWVVVFDCRSMRDLRLARRYGECGSFTFFILEHEGQFPELRIYPEDAASKLAQKLGYEDIDFESIEFSDAFCVRSQDRKFAYDVCHPRMMDYLLQHRDLSIEIERNCIGLRVVLPARKPLSVEKIPVRLKQLVEIRKLLPQHLFRGQAEEQR